MSALNQPQTFGQRVRNFCTFVWNSEEKTFLGRGGRSWAEIGFFYLIYYACLAGFFAAMMAVFNTMLDERYPRLMGHDSLLKDNPGLGYKPAPVIESTLVQSDVKTGKVNDPFIKDLKTFFEEYENITKMDTAVNCSGDAIRPDADEPCSFDINGLRENCSSVDNYGYSSGQPCVLLKLNKIFNWVPQKYEKLPEEMPQELKDKYDSADLIWVTCEGENYGDRDNIGDVEFFPRQGFSFKYFPYRNQPGYQPPLVFVKFLNPRKHVGIMIECKAWAKNIYHDRMDKQGSIHFELLVD